MQAGQKLKSAWGWIYQIVSVEPTTSGEQMLKLARIHEDGRLQNDIWTDRLCFYEVLNETPQ